MALLSWAEGVRRRAWETGLVCAFFATIIFSLSALQVKLTGGRVPVLELCVIRSCLSFCTSLSVGTAAKIAPLFGHRRHLPLLFLRGLFGTVAFTCSYAALLNLPLGDAVTLQQLRPPMMAVMGYLLLGEPLGWAGAAGCLISLTGAVVVSHPPFLFGGHTEWSQRRLLGTICGLASPLFGAGTGYCIRRIKQKEPALVVAIWFHIVTLSLLIWPLLGGWPQAAVMVAPRDAALLLGISCTSFCGQLLMTRSFQLLPAGRAASLNFLGVVYSHALGALVFGEKLTLFTLGGTALIFAGVLMVALRARTGSGADSSSTSQDSKAAAAAGSSSSNQRGAGGPAEEDAEAAMPLKAADQQQALDEQQQQQQPHLQLDVGCSAWRYRCTREGSGSSSRGCSRAVAGKASPAAASLAAGPVDVELGFRTSNSGDALLVAGDSGQCDSDAGDDDGLQQQLQPLLQGVSSVDSSCSEGPGRQVS